MVALTGRAEAYYTRHTRRAAGVHLGGQVRLPVPGPALQLAEPAARHARARSRRQTGSSPILQNHDQVANSARGLRGHQLTQPRTLARDDGAVCCWRPARRCSSRGRSSRRPRRFSTSRDHEAELAAAVRQGRAEFLSQFPSLVGLRGAVRPRRSGRRADVRALQARFQRADTHQRGVRPAPRPARAAAQPTPPSAASAPAASTARCSRRTAFVLRFFADDDRRRSPADRQSRPRPRPGGRSPEPLLAPPADRDWVIEWSSEDPRYGGGGTPDSDRTGQMEPARRIRDRPRARRRDARLRAATSQAAHGVSGTDLDRPSDASPGRLRDAEDPDALVTREWLVTNGLGGYASGTVAGVITRRYHGLSHRRAAGAARPDRDAEPPRGAGSLSRRPPRRSRRPRAAAPLRAPGHRLPRRVPPRSAACRSGATTSTASSSRSACSCTHMQNTVHVILSTLVDGADQRRARAASVGQFPRAGSAGQRTARVAVRVPRHRRPLRNRADRTARCRRCACMLQAPTSTFTLKGKRIDSILYPVEEQPRLSGARRSVEPRLLPSRAS